MYFTFHDEEVGTPAPDGEHKQSSVSIPIFSELFESLTGEEQVTAIEKQNPSLYSRIFGKGAKKGKQDATDVHIANVQDNERKRLFAALKQVKIDGRVRAIASGLSFIDPSTAVDLLQGNLTLNEDLEVITLDEELTTVEAEVGALVKKYPHLIRSNQRPGQGSSPNTPTGSPVSAQTTKRIYKRSELQSESFRKEHQQDLDLALREGRIIDDLKQGVLSPLN